MALHTDRPRFGTLLTAMVTPFKATGELDLDAARALARKLVDDGCDGLVVTGTTGETSTLTDEENVEMFKAVVEEVGDRAAVVAGTGTNDTRHSINLSRMAKEVGVDGLLLVTPYYNKPSQAGIQAHFEAIADAVDLPVMLYDIPGRSVKPIETETIVALAKHPNIVALKDAKGDLMETTKVIARTDLDIYSGEDGLTLPLLAIGAIGLVSVTAHIAAAQYRTMIDAVANGDLATARKAHADIDPLQRGIMSHLQGAVASKTVLQRQGVLPSAHVRLPLVEPTDAELAPVLADLAEGGLHL
ncbi:MULTISPECIES: 4-hydroxy-tetrahydrodipicolinate synthase [Micrococcaceae]|uniref:4-hydroxy-tetrahydrodipicolinate synthase n=1 Tax=Pseudoglutamicibacter albus TaxID=98671 RepID=A0ABU1YZK2_9MICC|nr:MULTISPECIES: 4-hydroxy-tetrahydrodipicolinate synthase [Micrococcaceae]MCG7304540.1 4-hydroxy-tetrahydrodipicolinate synthase [Pseudoglutamicibacter albus]MDR7293205.1 4-hydroxy-tetrahydrodipicolinate synthase [Pseudoglutamicibacter albus]OFT23701.1 4-hydroxy-tetrahydrodipicolinate synthase [Arthrobacter sp. HMSC08H08]OFT41619.1 4-hydroxy-tetrahydrodipicolinate synthase [Arthrobacter sp. HMSC06H05]